MTREEIINEIKCLLSELNNGEDAVSYLTQNDVKWLNENIKALEQESILDKIYADIQRLRGCSCSCSDGIIDDIEDIFDKYKAETEDT